MHVATPICINFIHDDNGKRMSRSSASRAGESCSEARGNISFGGPVGPENTSAGGVGGGGVYPLRLAKYEFLYIRT